MPLTHAPLLREAISNGLIERGFRRLPHGRHVRASHPGWCVVVDTGPRIRTADAASVYVGLHSHQVEQLLAELLELPHGPEEGTSASSYLGHFFSKDLPLTPGEKPGSITRTTPDRVVDLVDRESDRLAAIANLDEFLTAYPTPNISFDDFRYTTIHLLRGDAEGAAPFLVKLERSQCSFDGPVCDQYRRFRSNAIRLGGEAFERAVVEAEAAAPRNPRRGERIRPTLVGRLLGRVRAVVQANPDFANRSRDIPER